MILSLDEAHHFLDRLLDEGSAFAQLKCFRIKKKRNLTWQNGRLKTREFVSEEKWILRILHSGVWGVLVGDSFQDLLNSHQQIASMVYELSKKMKPETVSVKDIMVSKPIRQLSQKSHEPDIMPTEDELALLVQNLESICPSGTLIAYEDMRVEFNYWDSEHTRGENEYYNAQLNLTRYDAEHAQPVGDLACHFSQNVEGPVSILQTNWLDKVRTWIEIQKQESFKGPAPEDMKWILTPTAFAKLIYATLGPTLCLERPEPFHEAMNPGVLIGTTITSKCLTLITSPNIVTTKPFLDQGGVPAKRVVLIENGEIKSFILDRLSAHHLRRSLPIDMEKVLAGSSRTTNTNYRTRPDLQYMEAIPGDSIEKLWPQSHLHVHDVDVTRLNSLGDYFHVSIPNALVSKYDGLHRRHVRKLDFNICREELWMSLHAIDSQTEQVFLPVDGRFVQAEKFSTFLLPHAVFNGLPCTWS